MLEKGVAPRVHRVEHRYLVEDGARPTIGDSGDPRSWRSEQEALGARARSAGAS